jgi:phosphatidylglycerophosphatase A
MAGDTTTSRRPDARFLLSSPAHFIALGFGSGLAPKAPGTFGTLAALVLYWVLDRGLAMPPFAIAFMGIPLFALGLWASEATARDLGAEDDGSIVIDEMAAFLPLAALASASLVLQLVAFGLFRLFDIWKPPPIRHFERRLKGGMGIMFDDLVAACYAYLVLIVVIVVQHRFFPAGGTVTL